MVNWVVAFVGEGRVFVSRGEGLGERERRKNYWLAMFGSGVFAIVSEEGVNVKKKSR